MAKLRTPAAALAALLASCGTTGIRVPVLMPAPVNLVQYERIAVDRFDGDGCEPFSEQLTEALRAADNPMTGERAFEVLHRKDIDAALDAIRDRRGADWDQRTMEILDRWRTAEVALSGTMQQHQVHDEVVQEEYRDRQGNVLVRHKRRCSAAVRVLLQVTDLEGNTVFDRAELTAVAAAERRADTGSPGPIDHGPLLAQARARVVQDFLQRVLPHTVWVQVALYTDGDFPELQIGNGYAESGNWEMAIEAYRRALEQMTGPNAEQRHKALYNLGVAYEFTDRFAEARKALQEAYALGQEGMILEELQRVDRREQEVLRLRQQGEAARPAR